MWQFGESQDLQLLLMFIALQKLGCVTILLNTCLKYKEAQEQVVETDTEFMVVGDGYKEIDFVEEMSKMSEDVQRQLKKIIYAGVRQNIPYIGFNEIVENGETSQEMDLFKRMAAQLQVENPAVMLATSGTTGLKSKLVVLSMFHLVNGGLQKAEVFKMNTFDIVCMAMPLFHIFCLDVNVMAALMFRRLFVFAEKSKKPGSASGSTGGKMYGIKCRTEYFLFVAGQTGGRKL